VITVYPEGRSVSNIHIGCNELYNPTKRDLHLDKVTVNYWEMSTVWIIAMQIAYIVCDVMRVTIESFLLLTTN